jgi:DNA-binding HxlR family transcriptional regulator
LTARGRRPKRGGKAVRSGSTILALLATPVTGGILRQLSEGPLRLAEMSQRSAAPPQTTLRSHLKGLEGMDLIVKRGRERSPGMAEHALTEEGEDLLLVIASLEAWLALMPEGPLRFDELAGQAAIKSLLGSWSSMVLNGVAAGPISLSGLADGLKTVNYPSVERRLAAMRTAGQVETQPAETQGIPYVVTEWMRRSVAPLAAAIRWEQLHLPSAARSMSRIEIETAFLLAMPLVRVRARLAGSCQMDVEMDRPGSKAAGARAVVVKGEVVSSGVARLDPSDARVTGSQPAWAETMTSSSARLLEFGGRQPLAKALVGNLRLVLFGSELRASGR